MSALGPFLHVLTLVWGAAVLVAGVLVGRWIVAHERDLAPMGWAPSWSTSPDWLHDPHWWTVIVALAVARMLGDGVPLWIATLVGLGSGVLLALASARFVLLVVIPALVVEAIHVARGTAWLTGVGMVGWLVVPAVALAIASASSGGSTAVARRLRQWWPETIATATFATVELVLLPARLVLGLHSMAPSAWLWVPAVVLGAAACLRTARHGRAIVGVAIALLLGVAVQLTQVAGTYTGPLRTALVVVAVTGGGLLADAALAPRRRLA